MSQEAPTIPGGSPMVGDPGGGTDVFGLKGATSPTMHWPYLWGAAEILPQALLCWPLAEPRSGAVWPAWCLGLRVCVTWFAAPRSLAVTVSVFETQSPSPRPRTEQVVKK